MCRSKKPTLNMNPRGTWPRPPWLLPCSPGLWEAACPGVLRADGQRALASLKHLLHPHPPNSHPPHLVLRPSLHGQHLRCPLPPLEPSFLSCFLQLPVASGQSLVCIGPFSSAPPSRPGKAGGALCSLACAWCFCERSLRLHSFLAQ